MERRPRSPTRTDARYPYTTLFRSVPGLRKTVGERYSALAINPRFRRRAPEGEAKRLWHRTEAAASVWAIALIALVATGVIPLPAFAIVLAIAPGVALLNQIRTLLAPLWEIDGDPLSVNGIGRAHVYTPVPHAPR